MQVQRMLISAACTCKLQHIPSIKTSNRMYESCKNCPAL